MTSIIKLTALFLSLSGLVLPAQAARQVIVKPFAEIAAARTLQYPARVINLQLADIAAETSGRILEFPVQVGDSVNAGQRILQIDCTRARIDESRVKAGLKRLQANRQLTRQQLERAQRLSKTSSISREELDQRQTQLDANNASIEEQQALLDSASEAVSDCILKAPFAGTIIEKTSSEGSYVQPGSAVVKVVKENAVEVELELPADAVPHLKQAPSLMFELNGNTYPLKLRKVLPRVNSANFQQICRLEFISDTKPIGGSLGMVRFLTQQNLLPARYVQKRQGKFGYFSVQDNRARFIPLANAEEGQAVSTRITPDSLIITSHLKLLSDKEVVEVQP